MAGFWGRWKTPSQERVRLRVISVLRTAAPVSTPGLTLRSHWVEQQEALRARALRDQCTAVCTKSRRCTTAGETDAYLTRCIETQVLLCSVLLKWLTLKIAEDIAFLIKLIYSLRLYESPRRGLNLTLYLLFLQFAIICTYFCKVKMKTIIIVVWINYTSSQWIWHLLVVTSVLLMKSKSVSILSVIDIGLFESLNSMLT